MKNQKLSSLPLSLLTLPLLAGLTLLSVQPAESLTFQPKGSPAKTAGGASRGGVCLNIKSSPLKDAKSTETIAAVIPATDRELTVSAYPTVFVQIPQSGLTKAEFSLWDENSKLVYQTILDLDGNPGIVGLQVPEAAGGLVVGQRYQWTVAIVCDMANRQRDVVLKGSIERVAMSASLENQLNGPLTLAKAKVYAENGFWYDTISSLAELKRSNPTDPKIIAEWQELLNSVGLTQLSQINLAD